MKNRMICLLIVLAMMVLSSCSGTQESISLEEKDYKFINSVYEHMSEWDIEVRDGSQTLHVNKIAFFKNGGSVHFHVNFPIGGQYGWGYIVYEDSLGLLSYDKFDPTSQINYTLTSAKGTNWNYTLTDEEKYKIIEEAYLHAKEEENKKVITNSLQKGA